MLSCKEVTHLLSQGQDRPLSVGERMHLEVHLAMCRGCRNFRSQINFLRDACRHYLQRPRAADDGEPPANAG